MRVYVGFESIKMWLSMQNFLENHKVSLRIACVLIFLSLWPYANPEAAPHDAQRLISCLIFAIYVPWGLYKTNISAQSLKMLTGIYAVGLVAICASPMPFWSAVEFAMLWSVAVASVTFTSKLDANLVRQIAMIFVVVQVVYLLLNLAYYALVLAFSAELLPHTLVTGFSNIRFYAQFLIWTVPFVLAYLAYDETSRFKQNTRRFYLNISYKFGKYEIKKAKTEGGGGGTDF